MDTTFHLEIITPGAVLVSDEVESLEVPGVDGEFQVLVGHTPFLTGLATGTIVFSRSGAKTFASISGGFCEVLPEKTVILAHTAELSATIDIDRAKQALERARKRLDSADDSIDRERAARALERARNRLTVAEMH